MKIMKQEQNPFFIQNFYTIYSAFKMFVCELRVHYFYYVSYEQGKKRNNSFIKPQSNTEMVCILDAICLGFPTPGEAPHPKGKQVL